MLFNNRVLYMSKYSELKNSRFIVYISFSFFLVVVIWSYFATIDQAVRGLGIITTKKDIQRIQPLEGGLIKDIFFEEGDYVNVGDPLVQMGDISSTSQMLEIEEKIEGLEISQTLYRAKLLATKNSSNTGLIEEVNIDDFISDNIKDSSYDRIEKGLLTSLKALESEINTVNQRKLQAQESLKEVASKIDYLEQNLINLKEELVLNENAFQDGAVSGVDLLKLRRSVTEQESLLASSISLQARTKQILKENEYLQRSVVDKFRSLIRDKLNDVDAEIAQLKSSQVAIADRVSRTILHSPIQGFVKSIYKSQSGEVVKGGETILEIVPSDSSLIVEVKIKPEDIGYLQVGAKSLIKLTAYDFVIFGGLRGELVHLSADTITDSEGMSYYLGKVELDGNKTQFGVDIKLVPGMQAEIDILVGKISVLKYWLKPILRAKHNAMKEL